MKIRVITDSAVDIPIEFIDKYDIGSVRHSVHFDDKSLKLGLGISIKEYYKKLREMDELPTNSTPTPGDFLNLYKETFEKKEYDHVIYVALSIKLSGTANVARIAAKDYKDKITIIDTESASGVQGLILLAVIKLLEKNTPIEKIIEKIDELKKDYILDVGFFTLENVYKSGRLKSKFVLNLTKFIRIKPIAIMERPGVLVSTLPAFFTNKHMESRLKNIVVKRVKKDTSYDMIISHVENSDGAGRIAKKIMKKVKINDFYITDASPIIGTNTGFGTIIVSLVPSLFSKSL